MLSPLGLSRRLLQFGAVRSVAFEFPAPDSLAVFQGLHPDALASRALPLPMLVVDVALQLFHWRSALPAGHRVAASQSLTHFGGSPSCPPCVRQAEGVVSGMNVWDPRLTVSFAAIVLVLGFSCRARAADVDDPILGVWKLNLN